jgi:hypothetical protein
MDLLARPAGPRGSIDATPPTEHSTQAAMSENDWKTAPEELILYALLVVIGAIPVVIALTQREVFGVEATVGLLMVCAGAIGAIVRLWRSHGRTV